MPVRAEIKKNAGQPVDSATYPEVGAINILPSEARDDSSAYCVALNLWLQRAISSERKAVVPMPAAKFSNAIARIMSG